MLGRRRTRLTYEGWCFVLVLALVLVRASMKDINLMLAFAGMMAGALYFNWFALRTMFRRLKITRRLPESVSTGDIAVVELEAAARHQGAAIEIEDSFQLAGSTRPEDRGLGIAIFPQVARGKPAQAEYRIRFGRRGRYEFGTIRASSRFPFRLISRAISLRQPGQLVVLPRLGRLTSRWTNVLRGPEPGPRRILQRQGLTEGDFYGMRDWRAGDSRRWIHWRTSARRGKLMVRQFEQPRSENLTLLIDLWQPASPARCDEETVELAVSFAATIVADACRRGGCQLAVIIAGRELTSLSGGASRALARDVLQQLAVAEATSSSPSSAMIDRGLNDGAAGGRIVLVSTRSDRPHEAEHLAADSGSPQQRGALARMLRIDAGSNELFEYFQMD
ncbi:MAG TPA: DUF58 domain-containing protein [Pirellulales bacterium]|jgi:uncharacterized protein (DUF58 family)|nr:DUF58 domain-containing protein [Pirellulales bacterium]